MGFRETWKAEVAKEEAKIRERDQKKAQMSEQEKLAKTGNMFVKGFAIWYLIPFIAVALALMLMVGVWLWDMFIALF